MKASAFGLDIGSTSIKAVWVSREKNSFGYLSSLFSPTPPQGMQSESPFDQQEMAQLINKLVIDSKITTNNVNIALPESHVFTKVIDMPVLTEGKLFCPDHCSNILYREIFYGERFRRVTED